MASGTSNVLARLIHPLHQARSLGPDAVTHAVHGLVIFVAVLGATFVSDYPAPRMLLYSAGAVVLFWVAHVYAATLSHEDTADAAPRAAITIVRHQAKHALPILEACIAPALPLLLALAGLLPLDLAYSLSVSVAVAALAAFGFLALRNRGASLRRSFASAIATGSVGAAIIAAETFWH